MMTLFSHSKPIPGFVGIYEAHDDGTIWTVKGKTTFRILNDQKQCRVWKQRQLKPKKEKRNRSSNYDLRVELWENGKHKTCLVSRLVAMAFIPNPLHLPCINHIDGNSSNNNPHNLEWCTYKYNNHYAFKHGQINTPKPIKLNGKKFYSCADASRWLKRSDCYISNLLKHGSNKAIGKNGTKYIVKEVSSL